MPKLQDLTGQPFGKLVVEGMAHKKGKHYYWWCRCECGNRVPVCSTNLKSGHSESCGCSKVTHGMSRTPTWRSWDSMVARCYRQSSENYHDYGGRGIRVCDRWIESFENFLADMGRRPKGMTLDRENPDGNYEPNNCKWSTVKEQNSNKRSNVRITFGGRTMTVAQWADEIGGTSQSLYARLNTLGWPVERALTEPFQKRSNRDARRTA